MRLTGWRIVRSGSGDAFVLENPDYNPAILRLTLRRCVGSNLRAGAHRPRSEDVGEWNASLLFQKLEHVVGPLCAEFLVQGGAAHLRCISLNLNDVCGNALGLLRQLQELRIVLGFNLRTAVGKVNRYLPEDVVVSQFPETLVVGSDGGFVGGNCRLVRGGLLLLSLELCLLLLKRLFLGLNLLLALLDLLLVCLNLLLGRGYASLNVFCVLEVGAFELNRVRN